MSPQPPRPVPSTTPSRPATIATVFVLPPSRPRTILPTAPSAARQNGSDVAVSCDRHHNTSRSVHIGPDGTDRGNDRMKLVLIGVGVRSPLFAAAALRRAERIGLDELWLMDIDAERLELFAALVRNEAKKTGTKVRIRTSTDAE